MLAVIQTSSVKVEQTIARFSQNISAGVEEKRRKQKPKKKPKEVIDDMTAASSLYCIRAQPTRVRSVRSVGEESDRALYQLRQGSIDTRVDKTTRTDLGKEKSTISTPEILKALRWMTVSLISNP